MTLEQELARTKRLVSAAKALLSLQVGLAVGAHRIINCLASLGTEFEERHNVFSEFIGAIPAEIPIGGARLLWSVDRMLKTDKKLVVVEHKFREKVLCECIAIIRKYESIPAQLEVSVTANPTVNRIAQK